MIVRGTEALPYPSRKEFQQLRDIICQTQLVDSPSRLSFLASAVGSIIPHEFSACGAFNARKCELQIGHSSYGDEFSYLYSSRGFLTDPSIQLMQTTRFGFVTSEDAPAIVVPREVTSLKLDFGIKSCLSVGIRGVQGACTYFAFSNFDHKAMRKLRAIMQIISPHFHLAYLRALTTPDPLPAQSPPAHLTKREEEIMRWVAEGKTNWEISVILSVSLNTVKFHLKNIYEKLGGVENRWSAIANWQSQHNDLFLLSVRAQRPSEATS